MILPNYGRPRGGCGFPVPFAVVPPFGSTPSPLSIVSVVQMELTEPSGRTSVGAPHKLASQRRPRSKTSVS